MRADRRRLGRVYDRQAATYGIRRNPRYDAFRDRMLDRFAGLARPAGTRVLDAGAGPGYESVLLREHGLRPVAIDLSFGMAARCRSLGIDAAVMDLCELGLAPGSLAGVWMSFSLLHIPKSDAPRVLSAVTAALRPRGALMVLLFEGEGEGPRAEDVTKFGVARYFAYYAQDELADLLSNHVDEVETYRLDISPRPTVVAAGRRRPS